MCTTTWALATVASLTTQTAFRFAIRSDFFWVQEMASAFEMVFLIVASLLAVWIRCPAWVSALISALAATCFVGCMYAHHAWLVEAAGHVGWSYAQPLPKLHPRGKAWRADAERVGGLLADEVEQRAASATAGAPTETALADLAALVGQVHGQADPRGGGGRGAEVALALARHGLTLPGLRAASAEGLDVYAALRDVPALSTGERLAIATAVRRPAS